MSDSPPHRYRAFISYSKLDQHHARRLHSALETYRVPKGIDAKLQPNRRLGRFFRDDDEMGASTDLGGTLREAVDNSENLIVICSPHAARSKWVNAEILHFKNTSAADRIFAVITDGIPNSNDPELNCFPPAFTSEPLAIDLRKESFQRARIRLVAGLLGVSFDSLWQREKRRAMKRRVVAASATLVLASVIVLLGVKWLTERNRVHAARIDRTLVKVRDDLASERVNAALTELDSLTAEGEKGAVEDILKSSLAWLSTPSELVKEIKSPAFVTNGSQLFFLAKDGNHHLLNINRPYRRILSSNQRYLLIITDDEALVLNVADGRELARTATKGIQWKGHTFETRNGLLIVGGRFFGMTNGSLRGAFLVFSSEQQALTLFDEELVSPFFKSVWVSPDCINFGVTNEDPAAKDQNAVALPSDLFFFAAQGDRLVPTEKLEPTPEWKSIVMFTDLSGDLNAVADGPGEFTNAGCIAPKSDSASPGAQPGATGLFRPIGLGTFWESEQRWKVVRENVVPPNPWAHITPPDSPCTEERPCRVQNPRPHPWDGLYQGWEMPFISHPRGVHKDDRSFDSVNNEPVKFGYTQYNAAFVAAWCRQQNCFVSADSFELQQEETLDLRSNTGRFIFNPRGAVSGFQLYDLSTMRDVTPKGTEIKAGTEQADFSPKDERLFVAFTGRLLVFTPPSGDGPWQPVSNPGPIPIPALSGNKDEKVAALLALDDNYLVVVSSSGVISRFDWRTGQQAWARRISGAGEIYRAVVSKNRRFLLILGKEGGRLIDTADGLVLSGTLVPPGVMTGSAELFQCFNQAFVSDTGVIELICGEKEYRREPITFSGDARTRLREILADGFGNSSN